MNNLIFLVPIALGLGALGLVAFLWSVRAGQYEDLEGASRRILLDDTPDGVSPDPDHVDPATTDAAGRRDRSR